MYMGENRDVYYIFMGIKSVENVLKICIYDAVL